MHCQQLYAVDLPKQSRPLPETRGCLPVACNVPAHAGGICYAGTLVLRAPRPLENQCLSRGWRSGDTPEWCSPKLYRGAMSIPGLGSATGAEVVHSRLTAARASIAINSCLWCWEWTFILRGSKPIPRCCDRPPIFRQRRQLNIGHPVGRTSEITREPDVRCVRSKRSVGTCPAERRLLWPSDLPERHPTVLCLSQRDLDG